MTLVEPTDTDRLRSLVAELDRLLAPGAPSFAAVNPDGTPGNVAAGELIESAWGNAVANTITGLPRGNLVRAIKATTESGFGNPEYAIGGIGLTVPTAPTGRVHSVSYALTVQITQQPASVSSIGVKLRAGSVAGAVADQQWFPLFVGSPAGGYAITGSFLPQGLTPGTVYVVSIVTDGTARFSVQGGSWAALDDVT